MAQLVSLIILFVSISCSTIAQTNRKPAVYLFDSPSLEKDSCLCNDAYGFYYYLDENSNIYWVERNFCTREYQYYTDTIQTPTEILYRNARKISPHPVHFQINFFLSNGKLYLRRYNSSKLGYDTTLYSNLKSASIINDAVFHEIRDLGGTLKTIVESLDTIVSFNSTRFHCYKIREQLINATGRYEVELYLNKSNLNPGLIKEYTLRTLSNPKNANVHVQIYTLVGIMEVSVEQKSKITAIFGK